MPPRTVLITGATGLLGRAVVKEFERGGWNVIGTGFSRVGQDDGYQGEGRGGGSAQMVRLDLLDEEAMDRVLKEIRPDLIIHTAADRNPFSFHQDHVNQKVLDVNNDSNGGVSGTSSPPWRLNAITPGLLARRHVKHCNNNENADDRSKKRAQTLFIYISTDYVFPGVRSPPASAGLASSNDSNKAQEDSDADIDGPPYKPDAKTRPLNLYGESKRAGELAVLKVASEEDESLSKARKAYEVHDTTPTSVALKESLNRDRFLILRVPLLYGHTESNESPVQKGAVGVLVDTVLEASKRKGLWDREMRKWRKAKENSSERGDASSSALQEPPAIQKTVVDNWARRYPTCVEDVAHVLLVLAGFYLGHEDAEHQDNDKYNESRNSTANQNIASGTTLPRILHFTAQQCYTKYDICQTFADILGLNVNNVLVPDDGDDDNASRPASNTAMPIQRPGDTQLDLSETRRILQLARARSGNNAGTSDDIVENIDFKEWWKHELLRHR